MVSLDEQPPGIFDLNTIPETDCLLDDLVVSDVKFHDDILTFEALKQNQADFLKEISAGDYDPVQEESAEECRKHEAIKPRACQGGQHPTGDTEQGRHAQFRLQALQKTTSDTNLSQRKNSTSRDVPAYSVQHISQASLMQQQPLRNSNPKPLLFPEVEGGRPRMMIGDLRVEFNGNKGLAEKDAASTVPHVDFPENRTVASSIKKRKRRVSHAGKNEQAIETGPCRNLEASARQTLESEGRPKKRTRTRIEDMDPSQVHSCSFPGCNKKFAKKYNLKIHQRRHSGDLPFLCEYAGCGKRFMWLSSFSRHQRVHEARRLGVRRYQEEKTSSDSRKERVPVEDTQYMTETDLRFAEGCSTVSVGGMQFDVEHDCSADVMLACSLAALDSKPCEKLFPLTSNVQVKQRRDMASARAEQVQRQQSQLLDMRNPQLQNLLHLFVRNDPTGH